MMNAGVRSSIISNDKREKLLNIISENDDYERFIEIEQRVDDEKLVNPISLMDMKFLLRLFYRAINRLSLIESDRG